MNTVNYVIESGIATIQMNRPEVRNAINEEMHRDLYQAFQEARRDEDVKVIVLTGIDDAFSAGADIKSIPVEEMDSFDHGTYLEEYYNPLVTLIENIEKPVVAYINGTAVGAGLSLALACDMRFAEEDAKLALSFFGIGLTPDAGASYYLPRLVGLGNAIALGTGKPFTVKEGMHLGLIQGVGNPVETVMQLKRVPHPAYSWMKKNMKFGMENSLEATLEQEIEGQRAAGSSEAHKAAVRAFLSR
ncbi:enoyl-CoA hydratase/isomerase family protein [Salisediminibacterium selenitireducens]|uniref:Enoyl-CoA hydratase/isomerase n=1 Tax=Bacillus selenitireducens (strain ATCC 700615 / DSM 15326 / MLS10) TaxID=439292 RepID=D6Y1B8_BACIE|nr:enoyl-CoA hydratase/isomerase family protein [Salisediminibacterium selenitireducens]ADI00705.1 Enoyl-CoA hydratase/isomerase [[Bacillus] selenitireducens MLS10]